MSSNKTTNYQLHSWEPGDDFLRTEFNENFGALDTAINEGLAKKPEIVTGSYAGNGTYNRTIDLGFTPKALVLFNSNGSCYYNGQQTGGLAFPGTPLLFNGTTALTIQEGGFLLTPYINGSQGSFLNYTNQVIYYLAFR